MVLQVPRAMGLQVLQLPCKYVLNLIGCSRTLPASI